MQESTVADGQGSEVDIAQDHRPAVHRPTQAAENEEDKGLESHDEYEDAEEESTIARESQELNERVSRLMDQKLRQGWAMLQETCPNPACNGVSQCIRSMLFFFHFILILWAQLSRFIPVAHLPPPHKCFH